MLHDFMHIMAYIAKHPEERECLSCYLYRKQHEDVNFQTDFRKNEDNIDKQGKKIADKLEKSIQKALDKKKSQRYNAVKQRAENLLVPHVYVFSSNSAEQFAEQTENEKPQSVGIKGKIKNWD